MHVEYVESRLFGDASKDLEPTVVIGEHEVIANHRLGGGPTVCRLEVLCADGKKGRFYLSMAMKRGRPQARLTAYKKDRDMGVSAVGDWIKPDER